LRGESKHIRRAGPMRRRRCEINHLPTSTAILIQLPEV
jgi:hypothetical protein